MADDPKKSPLRVLLPALRGLGIGLAVLFGLGITFFVTCSATLFVWRSENFSLAIGIGTLVAVVLGALPIIEIIRVQKSRRRDD